MDILDIIQEILIKTKKQFDMVNNLMETPRDVDYAEIVKDVVRCKRLVPEDLSKQYDRVVTVSLDDVNERVLVDLMLVALVNACSVRICYEASPYYFTYTFFRTIFNRFAKNLHMTMPFVIVKHESKPKVYDFKATVKSKTILRDFMNYVVNSKKED